MLILVVSGTTFDAVREVKWRDDENAKRYKKLYAIDYSRIPKGVLILDNSKIPPQEAARFEEIKEQEAPAAAASPASGDAGKKNKN